MTKRKMPKPASSPPTPPAPPSSPPVRDARLMFWREVVEPTLVLFVNFVWRVLLLSAAVWLLAKYLAL